MTVFYNGFWTWILNKVSRNTNNVSKSLYFTMVFASRRRCSSSCLFQPPSSTCSCPFWLFDSLYKNCQNGADTHRFLSLVSLGAQDPHLIRKHGVFTVKMALGSQTPERNRRFWHSLVELGLHSLQIRLWSITSSRNGSGGAHALDHAQERASAQHTLKGPRSFQKMPIQFSGIVWQFLGAISVFTKSRSHDHSRDVDW